MSSKNQTIKNFFLPIQISNVDQTSTSKENVSTKRPLSPNDVTDISTKTYNNYDISLFCNKTLSQNEIYDILNKVWTPEINYKFPITSITSGKDQKVRNLKFQYAWLVRFP